MKRNLAAVLAPLVAIAAAIVAPTAASGAPSQVPDAAYQHNVCGPPAHGFAACHARVVDRDAGGPGRAPTPMATPGPTGLTPTDIQTAYGFPSTDASAKTIAIIDAFDNPTAAQDLSAFSNAFTPKLADCTEASGCFRKVDQRGNAPTTVAFDQGWALEIALDIQWAHAVAPTARILLVEADSNSYADLFAGVERAATMGANYISMSWGSPEFSGENTYDPHFQAPNISYFVSAGDNGTPAEYPSSSPNVISVGGTKLTFADTSKTTLSSETGWTGGGGGCSSYETKSNGQPQASMCTAGKRATPDISLDADPASGVSVYMGTPYNGSTGWFTVGGTSASAPMIAGRAALTGATVDAAYIYGNPNVKVRDITSGNNGAACLTGFDLCSGRGSWADNVTAPPTTTAVHVASVTYQSVSPSSFKVLVKIVDAANQPVPGASVTIQLKRASSVVLNATAPTASLTTATPGVATFTVTSAQKGAYTTKVTAVTGTSLSWNGTTPSNSYKR